MVKRIKHNPEKKGFNIFLRYILLAAIVKPLQFINQERKRKL